MKKIYLILVVVIIFFLSCKKDTTQSVQPKYIDSALMFLENAVSDSSNENGFYIKGDFNGHKICFATTGTGACNQFFVDTFMNAFFIYHNHDTVTSDNLYLLRQNSNQSIMVALYCGQTHIKNRSLPYSQPHPNPEHCEFTEMQFINMRSTNRAAQNSPKDNYTFWGLSYIGINITFTSLSPDYIIEGNFEGSVSTNTGSSIQVRNGKFRIKLVVDDVYIGNGSTTNNALMSGRRIREQMLDRTSQINKTSN